MLRIVYLSSTPAMLTPDDLSAILRVARHNNARDGITGMLAYHEGNIFQVIEGPEAAVNALWARLMRDPRHRGVLKLWSGPVSERAFEAWHMALLPAHAYRQVMQGGALSLRDLVQGTRPQVADRQVDLLLSHFLSSFRDLAMLRDTASG